MPDQKTVMEKIEEIVPLYDCSGCTDPSSEGTHQGYSKQHFKEIYADKFIALFQSLGEEVIGSDDYGNYGFVEPRNLLRAEQRAKLKELLK